MKNQEEKSLSGSLDGEARSTDPRVFDPPHHRSVISSAEKIVTIDPLVEGGPGWYIGTHTRGHTGPRCH